MGVIFGRFNIRLVHLFLGAVGIPHINYVRPGGWFLGLAILRNGGWLVQGLVKLPYGSGGIPISCGRVIIWLSGYHILPLSIIVINRLVLLLGGDDSSPIIGRGPISWLVR
jgi:hypothetical protein